MNQTSLNDLKNGDELAHLVRLEKIELLPGKPGKKPYLRLVLGDSTGQFFAKKWQSSEEELKRFTSKKHLFVTGKVEEYNGNLSAILSSMADPDVTEEDLKAVASSGNPTKPINKNKKLVVSASMFAPLTKEQINFKERASSQKKLKTVVDGEEVDLVARLASIEVKETKQGTVYLEAKIADSTAEVIVKQWDTDASFITAFDGILAVYVKGKIEFYKGNPQIKYEELRPITDADESDTSAFFVSSAYDPKFLWEGIIKLLNKIENSSIKALCKSFLKDETFKNRFKLVPAGVRQHHSFRHGLMEHTYRLMLLADQFVDLYNGMSWPGNRVLLNRDGVIAGCFLHDAYKAFEYEIDGSYAVEGNKLGHIARGLMEIGSKAAAIPDFPVEDKELLAHIVSAHHGQVDWGSPDTPCCPEAVIVHYLDNLSSKLDPLILSLNDLPPGAKWTESWVKALNKQAYIGGCSIADHCPEATNDEPVDEAE